MLFFMLTKKGRIPSQAPLMLFFLQLSIAAFFFNIAKPNVSTLFQEDGKQYVFSSSPALVTVWQGSAFTIAQIKLCPVGLFNGQGVAIHISQPVFI